MLLDEPRAGYESRGEAGTLSRFIIDINQQWDEHGGSRARHGRGDWIVDRVAVLGNGPRSPTEADEA